MNISRLGFSYALYVNMSMTDSKSVVIDVCCYKEILCNPAGTISKFANTESMNKED